MIRKKTELEAEGKTFTGPELLADVERQYKKRTKHLFPNSLGITGEVFHSGKICVVNKIATKHNFLSHIDNQSQKVKDVANLMFAPVYGHKEPIDEETGKP